MVAVGRALRSIKEGVTEQKPWLIQTPRLDNGNFLRTADSEGPVTLEASPGSPSHQASRTPP